MRLECRECEVICERVVHPWHCLRSGCEYVYAFEDDDTMYFGCLWKVFPGEFNMAVFADAPGGAEQDAATAGSGGTAKRGRLARKGQRRRTVKASDPYGAVRITRPPRPQCKVSIEQAYDGMSANTNCCNPVFFHQQFGGGADSIKLTAATPDDTDDPKT
jgi:hypothetical protein